MASTKATKLYTVKDKLMKNESGIVPFPWCIKKLVQMLYSSSQAIALK
jgi:hypothetical protein